MYQTRKLMRAGLSLAVLATASRLAVPQYAKATPVPTNAFMNGTEFVNHADVYDSPEVSGSPTTLTTGNWSYTCPAATCAAYGVSGGGSSKVDAGALGAKSNVSVSGTPPINYIAEAYSRTAFFDNLTITGGSGQGVLSLQWTIDGSVNNSGAWNESYGDIGVGGTMPSTYYSSINGGSPSLGNVQYFGGGSGTVVNFWVPFTFGTQSLILPFMDADSVFAQNLDATPYTAQTNFYDTATLTSALVYDGTVSTSGLTGSLVNDATILSDDGFSYGPDGLSVASTAVPEPGELPLFALGLGFLGLVIARRRSHFHRRLPQ